MNAAAVQQLRTQAADALAKGHFQQALALSIKLERLEPDEPNWPRRTAIVCQRMGRALDEVDALMRAGQAYARIGQVIKAAALFKQVLSTDPQHAGARKELQSLKPRRQSPPSAQIRQAPTPRIPTQAWAKDPDSGLEALPLKEVVPGASRMQGRGNSTAGIYRIPLADDPEMSLSLQLTPAQQAEIAGTGPEVPTAPTEWSGPHTPAGGGGIEDTLSLEDAAVLAVAAEMRAAERTDAALSDTPLFKELTEEAFSALLDQARLMDVSQNTDIFRQGTPGDALYVIAEGEVGVIDEGPPRRGICKLKDGDFFGEMALVTNAPRNATCTAMTDCQLIAIDRAVMNQLIRNHPSVLTVLLRFFKDRSVERLLSTNPLFTVLSENDRKAIKPYFRFLEVDPGVELITQGEKPDGLLVLLAGAAEAVQVRPEGEVQLGRLGPGEVCGEMSLLTQKPAMGAVRALRKCFAIEFPSAAFQKILRARPAALAFIQNLASKRSAEAQVALKRGPRQ